jgi:hypothetical protein
LLNELVTGNERKLILFVVPGADPETGKDTISGGVMSIVSICEESEHLVHVHGAKCFVCTLDGDALLTRHENFENLSPVFRFSQFAEKFPRLDSVMVHVPEFMVDRFGASFSGKVRKWWYSIPERSLNVLNQNIKLMPDPEQIGALRSLADAITITTAHQKYCTLEFRALYGVPLHKLSVWISPEQYQYKAWAEKEDLLVASPDPHPNKDAILQAISDLPGLRVQVIQGLTYAGYKELISRAKWSLTFGEGLDGYFIEPIFSGAISFAVFNDKFFTADYQHLPGIFVSWGELQKLVVDIIGSLEDSGRLESVKKQQYDICSKHYSKEQYRRNIAAFYERAFTYA